MDKISLKRLKELKEKYGAFTLIELLAVIIILTIIMVIAIPKVMDTIERSRISSFKSAAMIAAAQVEKAYESSMTTGNGDFDLTGSCLEILTLEMDSDEYKVCNYTIDDEGLAVVDIEGKEDGQFEGLICEGATKAYADCKEGHIKTPEELEEERLEEYKACFVYITEDEIESELIKIAEKNEDSRFVSADYRSEYIDKMYKNSDGELYEGVYITGYNFANITSFSINEAKCTEYYTNLANEGNWWSYKDGVNEIYTASDLGNLCKGGTTKYGESIKDDLAWSSYEIKQLRDEGVIYNIKYDSECVYDIVVPDEFDDKPVVGVFEYAFTTFGSGTMPSEELAVNTEPKVEFTSASTYSGPVFSLKLPNTTKVIGGSALFYNSCLSEITIPNGVEHIGSEAFATNSLKTLTLPDSVNYLGIHSFSENLLTSVKLSNNLKVIPEYAFYSNNLTSLVIPDSVEIIGYRAFDSDSRSDNQNQISTLTLGNNVKIIDPEAFKNNEITTLVLPESVEKIAYAAFWGNNITSLTIGSKLNYIGISAFNANWYLESINYPENKSDITYCTNAFSNTRINEEDYSFLVLSSDEEFEGICTHGSLVSDDESDY